MTDSVRIAGGGPVGGALTLPGCKGISHRALLLAGMASGESRIANLATGEDVARTATILEQVGVTLTLDAGGLHVVSPGLDAWRAPTAALDCGNSGSAMRFLLGLLSGRPFESTLIGDASLSARPMRRVVDPLRLMGARIDGPDDAGHAPLVVHPAALCGATFAPEVASAQVKTALLLAGLQAEGETVVVERVPTRDHTERMFAATGIGIDVDPESGRIAVGGGARRPEPFAVTIPGDPSTAAFFAVAAAILPGAEVTLEGVSVNPLRTGYLDVLQRMGARVEIHDRGLALGEPVGDITVVGAPLRATTIGGAEIPNVIDELPVLAVAAAVAEGETVVSGAEELRVKESDRIATTTEMLRAFGAEVEPLDDGFRVRGPRSLVGARVHSRGDHRIAMSAAIAALAATGETVIDGWSATAVSAPEFGADLEEWGVVFG